MSSDAQLFAEHGEKLMADLRSGRRLQLNLDTGTLSVSDPPTPLEPEIADALEEWVEVLMKEASGPGSEGVFVHKDGRRVSDVSFNIADVFSAIYRVTPEAVARMLQAGAAQYIRGPK